GGGQRLLDSRRGNRGPEGNDVREQRPALRLAQPHAVVTRAVPRAGAGAVGQQCPSAYAYAGKRRFTGKNSVIGKASAARKHRGVYLGGPLTGHAGSYPHGRP